MHHSRLIELVKKNFLFWLSRKIDYPLLPADALQINFTFNCNLRCSMCSMNERMESFKSQGRPIDLDIPTIKKLIKEGADMKVKSLILIGGEPFLEPRLFELVAYSVSRGLDSITVVTNGTIMTEKIVQEMFDSGLSHLSVSIDAATEEAFAKIRGQDYLGKIIRNVKLINEMKRKAGRHAPSVGCVCTIMDHNIDELMEVIELCRSLEMSGIIFQPVVGDNTDQERVVKSPGLFIPPSRYDLMDKAIDAIIKYKKNSANNFDFVANSLHNLEAIKRYFKGRAQAKRMNCYAGFNRIQVVQEGKLYFCVNQSSHDATLGDVTTESLKDLWYSGKARSCRAIIRKCSKPCLQWCSYRDDFNELVAIWQKRILFK